MTTLRIRGIALLIAVTALFALPTGAQAAVPAESPAATGIIGTWVGTYTGYVDGRYVSGDEKIVITNAREHAAKGTWQSKSSGNKWSKALPLQLIVTANDDGSVAIRGADGEGIYDGELMSDGRMVFVYSDPQPDLIVLRLELARQ